MSPIRVLVVDDSAFARKVIREILSRQSEIEVVGIARDGLEALDKITELRPDVITLDLVMPDLDGIGVLRALEKIDWAPKVVIVSVAGSDTELALEALHLGAIDLVTKPTPLPTDRLYELSEVLIEKVKAAALAKRVRVSRDIEVTPLIRDVSKRSSVRLVVVGTSTGGPQALTQLFRVLPTGLPFPIAVALHIPAGYTAPLAARISLPDRMKMTEAYDGMELINGEAVIAPGGMHLRIEARGDRLIARVSREPRTSLYHPSVDILFESAAEAVGDAALGVILTGMGSDGAIGAKSIKEKGGRILAESASSCVVYGMPRTVIEAGLADGEAPLEKIAALLLENLFLK